MTTKISCKTIISGLTLLKSVNVTITDVATHANAFANKKIITYFHLCSLKKTVNEGGPSNEDQAIRKGNIFIWKSGF